VSVGFAKSRATMSRTLPALQTLLPKARKVRIMGAAALGLAYVASGRLDAYMEYGLRIWDIAAGGLILECAGGDFWHRPLPGPHTHHIIASNGRLDRQLKRYR
jgi:myo-inositol-1(or 4)-monophosphatase